MPDEKVEKHWSEVLSEVVNRNRGFLWHEFSLVQVRRLLEVYRAAQEAAIYDWGTSVSQSYHWDRMAAMEKLRKALED